MSAPGTITLNGERREWPHTRTVEHLLHDLAAERRGPAHPAPPRLGGQRRAA